MTCDDRHPVGKPAILIRKAEARDAQAILDCLREAFAAYRDAYTPAAFLDTMPPLENVQNRLSTMSVFVAINPLDEILGTVSYDIVNSEEAHLRGMAVRPAWRGAGVASRLLGSVESELGDRECSRISLDTTPPLEHAIRFYENHGFRRSGRITGYFGMQLIEYVKEICRNPYPA